MQPLLQWKSIQCYITCVCICSVRYPACYTHAPYWPAPLYNIFPHYLINGTIFEKKKLLNTKCVFWFPLQLLSETFLIIKRNERDMIKHVYRMSQEEWTKLRESVPYVELYRYNPEHLYPKLNGYGDNGHRKVWASGVSTYCTPSVTPYSSSAHARQLDIAS